MTLCCKETADPSAGGQTTETAEAANSFSNTVTMLSISQQPLITSGGSSWPEHSYPRQLCSDGLRRAQRAHSRPQRLTWHAEVNKALSCTVRANGLSAAGFPTLRDNQSLPGASLRCCTVETRMSSWYTMSSACPSSYNTGWGCAFYIFQPNHRAHGQDIWKCLASLCKAGFVLQMSLC